MLRRLDLQCFKGFSSRVRLDFAPITLIYGANSSGKSSILQALLLLKQSVEQTAQPDSSLTFRSDELVNLGNFENIVYAHDTKRTITIGVGVSDVVFRTRVNRGPTNRPPAIHSIPSARLDMSFGTDKLSQVYVDHIDIFLDDDETPTFKLVRDQLPAKKSPAASASLVKRSLVKLYQVNFESKFISSAFELFYKNVRPQWLAELEDYQRFVQRTRASRSPRMSLSKDGREELSRQIDRLKNYSKSDFESDVNNLIERSQFGLTNFLPSSAAVARASTDANVLAKDAPFLDLFNSEVTDFAAPIIGVANAVRKQLDSLGYIGPLRQYPERNYIFSGTSSNSVGTRGENLPHILFSDSIHHGKLNELAGALGLGYEVKVTHARSRDLSNVFAVRLVDKQSKINVGLNDVGFGISQVLPILLQSSLVGTDCVLIEQPEIHLHPKLQAALGEVFAKAVGAAPDRQFIVETHSEHMLLRLQSLIRSGDLASEKVRVYFVSRDKTGSHVQEMRLAQTGDLLEHWPDGFFDDVYNEMFSGSR